MSEIKVVSTAATKTAEPVAKLEVVEKAAPAPKESDENAEESAALENEEETSDEQESDELAASADRPKQSKLDKRFKKLSRQKAELRNEVEYWKTEALKAHQSKQENPKKEAQEQVVDTSGEPDPDTFASHTEYLKAVTKWTIAQEKEKEIKEAKAKEVEQTQTQKLKAHQDRLATFTKTVEDFDDVVGEIKDIPMSLAVQDAILASENGPELLYQLAKDPNEYARVCSLPYSEATFTLGKFAAKLEKEKPAEVTDEKTKTKLTTAPKPISPVSGKAGGVKKSLHEASSQAEYEAMRREQMKTARRSAWR